MNTPAEKEKQKKKVPPSDAKAPVGHVNLNSSVKPKKSRRSVPRRGLTPEQYYKAELKIINDEYQLEKNNIQNGQVAGFYTELTAQAALSEAATTQNERIAGAKTRRGLPSKKLNTAKETRNLLKLQKASAFFAKFAKQTDQNFIALHMLTLAKSGASPNPEELKNLMLVSNYKGNLINKLTSSSKLQPLMSATPFELSQLTPYFRIFKKSKTDGVEEFEFMDHLKWTYKVAGKDEILNSSLGQGVGLKSFNWETTGTNMFSAPRTLMATLNLHFQSISELARSARVDEEGKVKWSDLIIPNTESNSVPRGCPTGYPSVDKLLNTTLTSEQIKEWERDPKSAIRTDRSFALMVDVGWKYGVNSDLSQELKNAVDNSRVTLDLTLVNHRFKFGAEGQIDLEVSYVARFENIMDDYSANLLNLNAHGLDNDIQKELIEKRAQIKSMTNALESPYGLFTCAEDPSASSRTLSKLDKKAKKLQEDVDALAEAAEALVKRLKISMYGKFTEYMIKNNKLSYVDVSYDQYANGELPDYPLILTTDGPSGEDPDASKQLLTTPSVDLVTALSSTDKESDKTTVNSTKILDKVLAVSNIQDPVEEQTHRVTFFYLGTLIDFFAGVLPLQDSSEKKVDRFEVVLGDVEFLDYKRIGAEHDPAKEVERLEGTDENKTARTNEILDSHRRQIVSNSDYRVRLNMANIPISFNSFTEWFTDEVINNDVGVFTFKHFIRALTTKLLVASLQSASNKYVNSDVIRTLKENTQVKAGVVGGFNAHLKRNKLNTETTIKETGESSLLISPHPISTIASEDINKQYFVIYVSRLPFASQEVNEKKNAEEGIYHLYIGADKGIVKSIDLEKEANNRIRDVNIMRAYNVGGNGLGIVQEPYNANVKIFGSGFFQPGQYVYINPTNMGLGTSHERFSIANKLGIGGFYLITKVATTIKEGDLETNLRCIFQNYGYLPDTSAARNANDAVVENGTDSNGGGKEPQIGDASK